MLESTSQAEMRGTDASSPHRLFRTLQAELLALHGVSARSRMLAGDTDQRVHVVEAGRGAPLVFVHGGGANAAAWASLLGQLQSDFHCFAVDRPGHGLSYRIDYRRIESFRDDAVGFMGRTLDLLGIERATLVGSSMGGFFSIAFALAHPERVERLVLVGAPAGMDRYIPPPLRALSLPVLGPILWSTAAKPTEEGMRALHTKMLVANPSKLTDAQVRCGTAAHRLPGASLGWLSMLRRFVNLRGVQDACYIRDELPKLTMPTLFVWGDRDRFAPPSSGAEAARKMDKAQLCVVGGAGHLPWIDAPEECARRIREFVGRPA